MLLKYLYNVLIIHLVMGKHFGLAGSKRTSIPDRISTFQRYVPTCTEMFVLVLIFTISQNLSDDDLYIIHAMI